MQEILVEHGKELLKTSPLTLEEAATELNLREGDTLNLLEELGAKRKGLYFYLGKKPPKPIPDDPGVQALLKQRKTHYENKLKKKMKL